MSARMTVGLGGALALLLAASAHASSPQVRIISSSDRATPVQQAGEIYRPPEDARYIHIRSITKDGDQVTALVGREPKPTPLVRIIGNAPAMRTIESPRAGPLPQLVAAAPQRGIRSIDISDMMISFDSMAQQWRGGGSNNAKLFSRDRYALEIMSATYQYGVEEALVRAVIHAESAFNPAAVSHAGAQGLMQLMPATARRFGVTDSFSPSENIRGGTQYLAWLLDRFHGDITLAVAAYNAGEGAVDRHGGVPPYRETKGYVKKINELLPLYRQQTMGLPPAPPTGREVLLAAGN